MRIENREMLNQLAEYAKQVIGVSKCRVLICAGTGCLAGGSGEIYKKMCQSHRFRNSGCKATKLRCRCK